MGNDNRGIVREDTDNTDQRSFRCPHLTQIAPLLPQLNPRTSAENTTTIALQCLSALTSKRILDGRSAFQLSTGQV